MAVHAAVAALRAAGGVAETLDVHPLPVYPEFFSDRITGMAVVGSRAAQRALLNGGLLFADNLTLTEPHRGRMQLPAWVAVHKDVWAASGSDAVMHGWMYSELETAYGFHAKTADVMPEMLAFFRRHGLERAHDPDV